MSPCHCRAGSVLKPVVCGNCLLCSCLFVCLVELVEHQVASGEVLAGMEITLLTTPKLGEEGDYASCYIVTVRMILH